MITDKAGGLQRPHQNSTAQFMESVFEICFSVLQRTAKGGQGGPLREKERKNFIQPDTFWEVKPQYALSQSTSSNQILSGKQKP